MTEEQKSYLNELKKHKENAREVVLYSMNRIDILIISISGAAIYACLESIKFSIEQKINVNIWLFKLSGTIFILAIIANIYSQWLSYKSNIYDMSLAEELIHQIENKTEHTPEIKSLTAKKEQANSWLSKANNASVLLLIGGLTILICSLIVIF